MSESDHKRAVIEVKPSVSSMEEAKGIGYQAGRDEDEFSYVVDQRSAKNLYAFRRNLVKRLKVQAVFAEKYLPMLQELVDIQARFFAVTLIRASEPHANKLYKGCPEANIRYINDKKFQKFVREVVPDKLQKETLLLPLELAFWRGWLEGSDVISLWRVAHGK